MWLIILALLALLFYIYCVRPLNYWKNRGVKYVQPVPVFGNMAQSIFQRTTMIDALQKPYDQLKRERFYGMYSFTYPILVVADLELIKRIGIKDFDHFVDHQAFAADGVDPLWSKNLFASQGNKWRHLRTTLSPSFTSSKMKIMFNLMSECSEQFGNFFLKQNKDTITVEMKDTFTRFTNDVIATCAFGIKCDSLENPNNDFYKYGLDASDFSGIKTMKFFLHQATPRLAKLLKIKIIDEGTGNFFTKLIGDTIKHRKDNKIIRPDMIHLLMEARKGRSIEANVDGITDGFATVEESNLEKVPMEKLTLTDEDITAQALIFFIAGFDTASSLMMYIAYELAVNKDIQDKLQEEINSTWKECNEKITYESLMKMKYLDMIVSETLRKWPPSFITDRICTKDYKIPDSDCTLETGSVIWFPIYQIHRDPDNYADPEKFDPERFSEENKSKIHTSAFIPFGIGPRNCIASRFALLENKIIFFHLLRHFDIVPVEKSVIPVVLSKKHFNMEAEGGMWLGFKRRNN